jgi:hypothetical protein
MCAVIPMKKIVQSLYDFLDVGKSPRPADCIFVLAGKEEHKTYGIKMWRFGYAPQLILGSTASFTHMDPANEVSTPVKKGFLEMRSEARELARYLRNSSVRSMLVVSSPANLRTASLVFRRAFRKGGVQLTFVAVPEKPAYDSSVWAEFRRFLGYRFFPF